MSHSHHHHAAATDMPSERYQEMRTVTLVGAAVNLVLAAAKIAFGWIGHSQALIADGVHSLSDLVSDALVLVAAKHGSREADDEHPYGHARIETAATVGLGVLLLLVAVGIGWDALGRMFEPESLLRPGMLALVVAVVSILAKEALYWYTLVVSRRLRSDMLRANAWHHRSDALSSVVVVAGIAGAMAGLAYLDAVATIGVALMIAKVGWDLAWHSLRELVDTGLEPEQVQAIRKSIMAVDGVKSLHLLKTRRMGGDALVDVHLLLNDPRVSVSEGHQISETVRGRLIGEFDQVSEVMVHIDPEDDELVAPNRYLPLRTKAVQRLESLLAPIEEAAHIRHLQLHYLNGKIQVELYFPLSLLDEGRDAGELAERLAGAVAGDEDLGGIQVYFE